MSDEELDKLATEMRNIGPSKSSRRHGMDAAMAAFSSEFASEQTKNTEEKIVSSQGLAAGPRPTGQSTPTRRVQTLGRDAMSNIRKIFDVKPQTLMMGGTCMAALIASFVVFQVDQPGTGIIDPAVVEAITEAPDTTPAIETPIVETPSGVEAPEVPLVSPEVPKTATAEPTTRITPPPAMEAPVTAPPITPPEINTAAGTEIPSNVVVIERRVLKTLARTEERTVPTITKQVTRRVVKTAARTQERVVPAITKEVSRRVSKGDGTFEVQTETVIVKPQSVDYVVVPAEYETVTETVAVQEASTELVSIPPVYETVRETIAINADGSTNVIKSETVPAPKMAGKPRGITSVDNLLTRVRITKAENKSREMAFRSRRDRAPSLLTAPKDEVIVTGARSVTGRSESGAYTSTRPVAPSAPSLVNKTTQPTAAKAPTHAVERVIPAITKQVSRRVVKTPASTIERVIPAITKVVTVQVKTEDGIYKNVTKTFVIQEASTEYITLPVVYETVNETVVVREASTELVVMNADGNVIAREHKVKPPNMGRDRFENYESNPIISAVETPVSTFSIDVDTASYSFLRASLNRGQLPPPGAIRLEEMINYFPYDYAAPRTPDEPFKANVTVTTTPWNTDTKLMHIGIKGYVPSADEKPSSNIVFLIDTSGSMRSTNKLPLLINSFKLLLNTLDEDDTVSIVTYAGSAGTVLEPTPASDKDKIRAALTRLRAGGSTAGAAGLELAYLKAAESFDDEGINRVILATDGDFNVGFSSPDAMKTFIKKKRETGIFLSVLGFGHGNYNDKLMQSLAQNGNGVAAYIDTLAEANKVLANEAGSALITIAKDVKIQVEFNPETISEYRLIGYETRALRRQDFNNDKVDAGDIGAGHSVTAIYEITPVDSPSKAFDPLRYVASKLKGTGSDEYAFVKIRHKLPKSDTSTLQTFPVGPKQERSLKKSTDDMRFAAAVAAFGQKLRGDTRLADFSYDDAIELASSAKGEDENGYRAEFIQLVRLAKNLQE